jgi:hypothetical protein
MDFLIKKNGKVCLSFSMMPGLDTCIVQQIEGDKDPTKCAKLSI